MLPGALLALLSHAFLVTVATGHLESPRRDEPSSPQIPPQSYGPGDAQAYNKGDFGDFPILEFKTTDLVSPKLLKKKWGPECSADDRYHYFLAMYGYSNDQTGPIILDSHGHMVWHQEDAPRPHHSYGLSVQEYRGEPYLTWWTGDDHVLGHGVGSYYMLDSSYNLFRKLGSSSNIPADLHEFKITSENTVIHTSFVSTPWNLQRFGKPADGAMWDGVFQEYDLETGKILFQWRASDHLDIDDCTHEGVPESFGTEYHPWDWFHINSVDKDKKGNYLVSARYCAIMYVSGRNGKVLWHLGGKKNSFKDLSGGNATNMVYQHHALWADEYTAMTIFDNRATSQIGLGSAARGLKLDIDLSQMTVELRHDFIHPEGWTSISQGSMQTLDNGNFLLGYGYAAAFTEFDPLGRIVCDAQFAPLYIGDGGTFRGGAGQSYRVFKQQWVGKPTSDPKISIDKKDGAMYVSWNGATEVRRWRLEGSADRKEWNLIREVVKYGFESKIDGNIYDPIVFRLTALDYAGEELGKWFCFPDNIVESVNKPPSIVSRATGVSMLVVSGGLLVAAFAIFSLLKRRRGAFFRIFDKSRWNRTKQAAPQRIGLLRSFYKESGDEIDDEMELSNS